MRTSSVLPTTGLSVGGMGSGSTKAASLPGSTRPGIWVVSPIGCMHRSLPTLPAGAACMACMSCARSRDGIQPAAAIHPAVFRKRRRSTMPTVPERPLRALRLPGRLIQDQLAIEQAREEEVEHAVDATGRGVGRAATETLAVGPVVFDERGDRALSRT